MIIRRTLAILTALTLTGTVWAATASPSATATPTGKAAQIEDLKERLATKVAELRQTQKKAVFGLVKAITVSTVTIETPTKDLKIDLPDEIVVYQTVNGKRTKLAASNIEKDDVVAIFGDHDTTLDLLTAKVVIIQSAAPSRISGTVSAIDKTDFTLTINSAQGESYIIDIETNTRTQMWTNGALERGGFSRINVGDVVHVIGTNVKNQETRVSARRLLDLGNLREATATPAPSETASPSATPATTKAATATPSRQPTPSATKTP